MAKPKTPYERLADALRNNWGYRLMLDMALSSAPWGEVAGRGAMVKRIAVAFTWNEFASTLENACLAVNLAVVEKGAAAASASTQPPPQQGKFSPDVRDTLVQRLGFSRADVARIETSLPPGLDEQGQVDFALQHK